MSDQTTVLHDQVEAAANQLRAVGDTVQTASGQVGACTFGSASAGREYGGEGSAVQAGTDKASQVVTAWQAATTEVGNQVLVALGLYSGQEGANTGAVTGVVA